MSRNSVFMSHDVNNNCHTLDEFLNAETQAVHPY